MDRLRESGQILVPGNAANEAVCSPAASLSRLPSLSKIFTQLIPRAQVADYRLLTNAEIGGAPRGYFTASLTRAQRDRKISCQRAACEPRTSACPFIAVTGIR